MVWNWFQINNSHFRMVMKIGVWYNIGSLKDSIVVIGNGQTVHSRIDDMKVVKVYDLLFFLNNVSMLVVKPKFVV